MIGLFCFVLAVLGLPFKSKLRLEAENAVLRHQLIVLRRSLHGRVRLTNHDRWFLIQLYRWFPSILQVLTIIRPETLVRWHRAGFRCYWRWKSRRRGGWPQIETELRALIRLMSMENPLWGAPRIHGELLKLGFEIAQSSVAKYTVKRRGPPSQGWRTFLHNHAPDIAAMDLFVVPNPLMHLFNVLKGKFSGKELNLFRNWLKHATGPDKMTIDELEVVVAISRAIQKFVATFEESHQDFEKFSKWAMEKGYIKTPLVEKKT
jgi:hypothetical protein